MSESFSMTDYDLKRSRACSACGRSYTVSDYWQNNESYFHGAYNYRKGYIDHCLDCWLGVGPNDFPVNAEVSASNADDSHRAVVLEAFAESGPVINRDDDLLAAYGPWLEAGCHLAVMPVARIHIEWGARYFLFGHAFYPAGGVDLTSLNVIENRADTGKLSEFQAEASGVTAEVIGKHHVVIFPCRFDWADFERSSHDVQLDLLRSLSAHVDRSCLDFIRYSLCQLGLQDTLPARAGQLDSNPMMSGVILYNHALRESRVIGGAAFHRMTTRGIGLVLDQLELDHFPGDGEVGKIVQHALTLFTAMLEASDETAMFMQALGLLEFLAYPDEYRKFEDVKKVIARYVARDASEYQKLMDRFFELTGKKDANTGKIIGFRTQVVHMGERIERLVPRPSNRRALLRELQLYIGKVIDHMVAHSELTFEDYLKVRETLKPFEK
jgi:hypothetical protein